MAMPRFVDFYQEIFDRKPYTWQERLADLVESEDWPRYIKIPTGSGKTAAIAIGVYAMAVNKRHPRRLFFVVDRRIVVDQATKEASKIATALRKPESPTVAMVAKLLSDRGGKLPLVIASLRGGRLLSGTWAQSPVQPLVCCSTVDQVGSALLFRSYGARSSRMWPIHAALAGRDSLIILDEAHLSEPFEETVAAIRLLENRAVADWLPSAPPVRLVSMTATPHTDSTPFELKQNERQDKGLQNRLSASKPAKLVECEEDKLVKNLVSQAREHRSTHRVIAVVVNRVGTARAVFEALAPLYDQDHSILILGRSRPFDRDNLWQRWDWEKRLETGEDSVAQERPGVLIVSTQCIEAGADLDFDALITEAASLAALRQRFGRLNRSGRPVEARGVIVRGAPADKEKAKSDPIYGPSLQKTWEQLNKWAKQGTGGKKKKAGKKGGSEGSPNTELIVDFGVEAMDALCSTLEDPASLRPTNRHAPVLLPAHLDLLSHTEPQPDPDVSVEVLLHGPEAGPPDVQIIWRKDLYVDNHPLSDTEQLALAAKWREAVEPIPPLAAEGISVPFIAARQWLSHANAFDVADQEGASPPDGSRIGPGKNWGWALCWRGKGHSYVINARQLKPGMTIVVPHSYGGCDRFGWNPESSAPVNDVADDVLPVARGKYMLRIAPKEDPAWEPIAAAIREKLENEDDDLDSELSTLSEMESVVPSIRTSARELLNGKKYDAEFYGGGWIRIESRYRRKTTEATDLLDIAFFEQESDESSLISTGNEPVALAAHLNRVGRLAKAFAEELNIQALVPALEKSGNWHDLGKSDPRFQASLGAVSGQLLAKSTFSRKRWLAAVKIAGWPTSQRHELYSVRAVESLIPQNDPDRDLILHLVASHHGFCRPFAPPIQDKADSPVNSQLPALSYSFERPHRLEALDSGVAARFHKLTRRYGWYGLALLETILRLADHRVSELEEQSVAEKEVGQ